MYFLPSVNDFILMLFLSLPFGDEPKTTITSQSLQKLTKSSNEFALSTFKLLSTATENDILSTISLTSAFVMLYNGANGETADDLRTLLRFEQNNLSDHEVNNGFRELLSQICSKNSENLKFSIANRAIVSEDFRIKIEYENNLKKNFNASIKSMDLVKDGFIAIQIINDWIEAQTNGKIKKLFETPFDPLTKLVLLNVVYFKGDWLQPFSPKLTYNATFFNYGFNETNVELMFQKNKRWNYTRSEELDSQLLELPYFGNDFSLVVILPQQRNGLEKLKSTINYDNMKIAINSMKMTRIEVHLPKFKIEQKYELKSAFNQKLNLKVFTNEADLSKIVDSTNLKVTKVLHKVAIEVNERGSEAAAVTAIEISLRSQVMNPLIFEADHPFLYLIRDKTNGLIHFIGQITVF